VHFEAQVPQTDVTAGPAAQAATAPKVVAAILEAIEVEEEPSVVVPREGDVATVQEPFLVTPIDDSSNAGADGSSGDEGGAGLSLLHILVGCAVLLVCCLGGVVCAYCLYFFHNNGKKPKGEFVDLEEPSGQDTAGHESATRGGEPYRDAKAGLAPGQAQYPSQRRGTEADSIRETQDWDRPTAMNLDARHQERLQSLEDSSDSYNSDIWDMGRDRAG